jgi:hypothetical protein
VRTALPAQGRNSALAREKAPPMDADRAERPASIRDTLIRWLNQEL